MFTFDTPSLDTSTGTMTSNAAGLRGDTCFFTISNDALAGWDGRTWTAQIKANAVDADPVASFEVTDSSTSEALNVYFQCQTDSIDVGKYVYDVQAVDGGGVVITILMGKITLKEDVSRD